MVDLAYNLQIKCFFFNNFSFVVYTTLNAASRTKFTTLSLYFAWINVKTYRSHKKGIIFKLLSLRNAAFANSNTREW